MNYNQQKAIKNTQVSLEQQANKQVEERCQDLESQIRSQIEQKLRAEKEAEVLK